MAGIDNIGGQVMINGQDVRRHEAMSGRIFIQFIALILTTYLRSVLVEKGKSEKYDVPDILHDLEPLQRVRVEGLKRSLKTTLNKHQREILDIYDIEY